MAWQVSRSVFVGSPVASSRSSFSSQWTMRDTSASYWFKVGDRVQVVADVYKGGANLRQRTGVVMETWEKCNVDPTCCCAEQVDTGMAVRVEFQDSDHQDELDTSSSFMHYFAEDELVKVETNVPFDGMTCGQFKLQQLQTHQSPRAIAFYDPMKKALVEPNSVAEMEQL